MTSSHHAPYVLGYTRTTMVGNKKGVKPQAEQPHKPDPGFGSGATRLREVKNR